MHFISRNCYRIIDSFFILNKAKKNALPEIPPYALLRELLFGFGITLARLESIARIPRFISCSLLRCQIPSFSKCFEDIIQF